MIRVFIADAHELLREGLRSALMDVPDMNIIGEFLCDGADRYQRIAETRADVVLIQPTTSQEQTIRLTQSVKQSLPNCKQIIFISPDDESLLFACLAAGVDGYVHANCTVEQVVLAVRTVATGAAWLDRVISVPVLQSCAAAYFKQQISIKRKCSASVQKFSAREKEVLQLLVQGLSNSIIAKRLFLSQETVKTHVRHVMQKLDVDTRTEAAVRAVELGYSGEDSAPIPFAVIGSRLSAKDAPVA